MKLGLFVTAFALALVACAGDPFEVALFDEYTPNQKQSEETSALPSDAGTLHDARASDGSVSVDGRTDSASVTDALTDAPILVDAGQDADAEVLEMCPVESVYYVRAAVALAGDRPRFCPPQCGPDECCYISLGPVCVDKR